jgi:ATP-dependent Lhr-like helicase
LPESNFYKLNKNLQDILISKGFSSLRSIQEQSIEVILNNENVLILAPTASGKTEAALLPIMSSILNNNDSELYLKCLYVAPLKALINDIEERLIDLKGGENTAPYILKWHGDVPRSKKLKGLKEVPDILLTTPESLEVLLVSPHIDHLALFKKIQFVIIDEIHNFAFSPRGSQLISILSRLDYISETSIQKIGLSATIGNPQYILEWMCYKNPLKSSVISSTELPKKPDISIRYYEPDDEEAYFDNLKELCSSGKTLIFNNSKYVTEKIAKDLESLKIHAYVHHGSLSKFIREDAEDQIKNESRGVISATSTLELGIDIGDLDKVVQNQVLPSVNSFLQRIGRTGRRSGKNPFIACLSNEYDHLLLNIAIVSLGIIDKYSEPLNPSTKRYDILFQQLLSEAISEYGINKQRFFEKISKAYCFKEISIDDLESLIRYWHDRKLIRIENDDILLGVDGEKIFGRKNYLELFSVFDSNDQYEVIFNKDSIGVLDSWFVKSKTGDFLFRLAGKKWKVKEIDDDRKTIDVVAAFSAEAPFWQAEANTTIEYKTAQRVREILNNEFDCSLVNLGSYEIDILKLIKKEAEFEPMSGSEIKIIVRGNSIFIFTYAGTIYNTLLSILLEEYSKVKLESVDPYKIEFKKKKINIENLKAVFEKVKTVDYQSLYPIIYKNIDIWRYSKYSEYIPEDYCKHFIMSQYFNLNEFLNYINIINLLYC